MRRLWTVLAAITVAVEADITGYKAKCSPQTLERYQLGDWPRSLDSALYWVGPNDELERAGSGFTKFYHHKKPTVIYFHGWTGMDNDGWVSQCHRGTMMCPPTVCSQADYFLAQKWLDLGWNVGVFFWEQFSDEKCVRDAEQKVWFDFKESSAGLRYLRYNESTDSLGWEFYTGVEASVGDICEKVLSEAMLDYRGPRVRFVGHSIGGQLAVRCASLLSHKGHPAAPQRIAMLEPQYSLTTPALLRCGGPTFFTDQTDISFSLKATADTVGQLFQKYGTVTEVYRSSGGEDFKNIGLTSWNPHLEALAAVVHVVPDWCGGAAKSMISKLSELLRQDVLGNSAHMECRHDAVFAMYFLGIDHESPVTTNMPLDLEAPNTTAVGGCPTPSAKCLDRHIEQWVKRQLSVDGGQNWVQNGGTSTIDVSDDTYELLPGLENLEINMSLANAPVLSENVPGMEKKYPVPFYKTGAFIAGVTVGSLVFVSLAALLGYFICKWSAPEEEEDSEDLELGLAGGDEE